MIRYSSDGRFMAWHAPGADLDYGFDWKRDGWLEDGERVVESTWVTPDGLTMHDPVIDTAGEITAAYFAGGEQGQTYVIENRIVTDAVLPRKDSRTITLTCKLW